MKTLAFILVLGLVSFLGCAATESATCKLDDKGLKKVVTCVKEKVGEEILGKLNAVVKDLHCDDFECAIKKVCTEHHGDLEKGTAALSCIRPQNH